VIHSLETTAANEHDLNVAGKLMHGEEQLCWCDAGYQGAEKRKELADRDVLWQIAERPGKRKTMSAMRLKEERTKASVRARVEHPFRRIKIQFGYSKVRYRGLSKNTSRLTILAAFSNLLTCQKHLLA
jgi:IS5 family transposase